MRPYVFLFFIVVLNWLSACVAPTVKESAKLSAEAEATLKEDATTYFEAIAESDIDVEKYKDRIALGKKLYFEKRLSVNNTISCNSCHAIDRFGVDNEPTSPGHDGTRGGRNSPTVLNASLHFAQFWDGRAENVEEQALGPILNPIEHGLASAEEAMKKIDTEEYRAMFRKSFSEEKESFTYKNVGRAIGAFERTLLTPSRFDDYLAGDSSALKLQEKLGLRSFMDAGCITCHAGVSIGGDSYQMLGAVNPYPSKDLGRYEVTKQEWDKLLFKVPGLRNVEKTYPYFHDGSITTLRKAIELMAHHQLDVKLENNQVDNIEAFLKSLTAKKLPVVNEL